MRAVIDLLAYLPISVLSSQFVEFDKRQNCPSGEGYFEQCGGCCNDVGLAGCYKIDNGISPWRCYDSPPGDIVSYVSQTGTLYESKTSTTASATSNTAISTAGGTCDAGESLCGFNCMPSGATCCPDKGYCPIGEYCLLQDDGDYECCPNGQTCSTTGATCATGETPCGSGCMPIGSSCCPDKGYCSNGDSCYLRAQDDYGCCPTGQTCGTVSALVTTYYTPSSSSYTPTVSTSTVSVHTTTPRVSSATAQVLPSSTTTQVPPSATVTTTVLASGGSDDSGLGRLWALVVGSIGLLIGA